MTSTDVRPRDPIALKAALGDWRSGWQARWRSASPNSRTRVQLAVFIGVVIVAYHYSLSTLLQSLNLDTPLAYIGLVPFIALGLAAIRAKPSSPEPAIHDRQLDYIVGLPLMASALALNLLMPKRLSVMFWVWRIDLLSMPFFVAGAAAIIFGVRALWRQRLAVAYLFLVWPVPYTYLLLRELTVFTNLTVDVLHVLVGVVRVAVPVASADGSVFQITSHGRTFPLSVVSACSGVNGMVGFLLVGTAFGAIVKGPKMRKALWLLGGLGLLWLVNLGRLLLIFWAGQTFGEHFAIKVLHPVVGLFTFNIGIVIMLLLLRPAGLHIGQATPARRPHGGAASGLGHGSPALAPSRAVAVPAVYSAVAVVVAVALVLGLTNSNLRSYDLVASATGEPKLASYLASPGSPTGWSPTFSDRYDWAKPYFGESSLWYRYTYSRTFGTSDLAANLPVFADVINTSDLSSFSAYGVEACYRFHGYSLRDVAAVNLGGGINGQALSYGTNNHQNWSIVYWIWPVVGGSSTRYERIILYMLDAGANQVSAPGVTGLTNVRGSLKAADQDQHNLIAVRGFLVGFAREIIRNQPRAGAQASKA